MKTRHKDFLAVLFIAIYASTGISNGCQMEGVDNWLFMQFVNILDIHDGVVISRSTTDILSIARNDSYTPYMDVFHSDGTFVIQTTDRYRYYEEYETAASISIVTTFNCVGGATRSLTFVVEITDTNNNDPIFRPDDTTIYEFAVTPPLPPGFPITTILNPLIVRDIDLTTQKIDFAIFDNIDFVINYNEDFSSTPKEFGASLRTTTFIRSIPEPIEFIISATDVDLTGDPQRTRNATVRILSDGSFDLPDELVFTQTFYVADYVGNNEIIMQEQISLQQGYHEDVVFSLDTRENSEYFEIVPNGNNVTLRITTLIPVEILSQRQIFLVIRANRQYTSGTSTTVVLQLPEDITLQFEKSVYEGAILDNQLQLSELVLSQGYENQDVSIEIQSEFSHYFDSTINENKITLSMTPLDSTIIIQNAFINLQIVATTTRSLASTVATLEIIKNDKTTPIFEHAAYVGSYHPVTGLDVDEIVLVQGYDDTVTFELAGDYSNYFNTQSVVGQSIGLTVSDLPPEIFSESPLLLTILAKKPRTVGANAAISITLPSATELSFLQESYRGTIEDNNLSIETIRLGEYVNDIELSLTGDLAQYFNVTIQDSEITLGIQEQIQESILLDKDFLLLSLSATAMNAIEATTAILLEVIKEDTNTPVFNEKIYAVHYSTPTNLNVPSIYLIQGYDDSVTFQITGEHSEYFTINPSGNNVELIISKPIPEELIFEEKVLVFNILAEKPLTVGARAAISVNFPLELTEATVLAFSKTFFTGTLDNAVLTIEDIELSMGFTTDTIFTINGEYNNYFEANNDDNIVKISQTNTLPSEITNNKYIALELEARRDRAVTVSATIIIDIVQPPPIVPPIFSEPFYRATYTEEGLQFEEAITLSQGFDETVTFELEGEFQSWFDITNVDHLISISVINIPENVLETNHHLVFSIVARKIDGVTEGRATIVIDLPRESPEPVLIRFTQPSYVGSILNNTLILPSVTLATPETYSMPIELTSTGEYSSYFELTLQSNIVNVTLINDLPSDINDSFITINVEASYPDAISGFTALVIELEKEATTQILTPVFERAYYVGEYSSSQFVFDNTIQLIQGFDETVSFTLEGDAANYFELVTVGENQFNLSISGDSIDEINDRTHLLFSVVANNAGTINGEAAIVIMLPDVSTDQALGFERNYYLGSLSGTTVNVKQIVLNEGFSPDVTFSLVGELAPFFSMQSNQNTVTISLPNAIPENLIPASNIIIIQVEATAPEHLPAYVPIVFEVEVDVEDLPTPIEFEETYYVGSYTAADGLTFDNIMTLAEGYDQSVEFHLEGESAQWFTISRVENGAKLELQSPIPSAVLANNQQLVFVVRAERQSATARATIVILFVDGNLENLTRFDKVLYKGRIQGGIVQHELIVIAGYESEQVDVIGTYSTFFNARHSQGFVVVESIGSLILPSELQHVALELRADNAAAVLVLEVTGADPPVEATVTFSSMMYEIRTTTIQTGIVGQVEATADNEEPISYSLLLDDDHLRSRLSINSNGELRLSAPADSGEYELQVVATTVFTRATGSATVYFAVDVQVEFEDNIVIPPLVVTNRDEEEPHRDIVQIDPIAHKGCQYSLKNIWPVDQSWLYVDDTGLHALAIDREHESIAFMALSQIKVELTLHCNSNTRRRRSVEPKNLDWLGPYDYGTNTWLLGQTIEYNPKKTIVNLIVNDINDNHPIFVGKENEPIAVGFPVPELLSTISPRYLIEVKATDADVGENAALVYWSSESQLAVSSSDGYVYVRNDAELTQGMNLVVSATDLNGQGLTGTLLLTVKLLNLDNIAVLTIQDAFLEEENRLLSNISSALGFELKALRSVVESNTAESTTDTLNREKRVTNSRGVSVQIYVYGLMDGEVVAVDTILNDISEIAENVPVNIRRVASLQQHLEGTCPIAGRNTALLVSTIVLSVLLFLIIVAVVAWFILLRWKARNYEQFSDTNSESSKIEPPKTDLRPDFGGSLHRLNVEELKRSEQRLQNMINTPVENVVAEPTTSTNNSGIFPIPDIKAPIIIQDKLKDVEDSDDDEFGERKKGRRKSVVTFNENVEKIIHVEDNPDEANLKNEYEVYRL